jgi:hypothetical protein
VGKTISDAIDEVVDDVQDEDETTEETTESEESTEEESGEGSLLDEEDEEEESTEDTPDRTKDAAVEAEEEESDEADIFDQLTQEQLAEIKANPAMNKLRKQLMRGYNTKTAEHAQLVQLGEAYQKDPQGILRAIAQQLGMDLVDRRQQEQQQQQVDPGKELEELFGEQIGPKVRAVFDKWAEARMGARFSTEVAPLRNALGRIVGEGQQARMVVEEQNFKSRHKDLSPQMEKAIIDLGNSGRIVPGRMSPQEYLDTLHDIVSARMGRTAGRQQTTTASSRLANRISANRRDREPSGTSGRGGTVKSVSKIGKARNISEALDFAMDELESEEGR